MDLTRRRALKASAGALLIGIAGCTDQSADSDANSGDDEGEPNSEPADESEDDGESDSESETPDEHEEESTERSLELLAEEEIDHGHACLHAEFDPRTPLEAGESADESPTESDTHVIWEVTYEGDAGYVGFDADEHERDESFVFYTAYGSAVPVQGTVVDEGVVGDDDCSDLDEYIQVAPDDGQIVLEVST